MKRVGYVVLVFSMILGIVSALPAQKVTTVDGIEVIVNPKKPNPPKGIPSRLVLTEDFSVGWSDNLDEAFSEITALAVSDAGSLYAVDMKENNVKVFDSLGKYIRTIGSKGQGPGELNMPVNVLITVDGELMVEDIMNRRLAFFDLEGNFLRNQSVADRTQLSQILFDSQGNSIAREMEVAEGKLFWHVRKYDKDLNTLFDIDKYEFIVRPGMKINPFDYVNVVAFDHKDNILYSMNREYKIKFLTPEGKHFRTIEKDFDPEKFTEEDEERMMSSMPNVDTGAVNIKEMIEFPKHFPPFESFTVDEEGRLIVRSYRKGKGENVFWLDVFDTSGRYISFLATKASPRIWKKGKMYSIEENEDGIRIIKRYSVSWK